ncbi:MAG TPA: M28 family peptidase, partial [Bacteroidales bacterium]|nr:M28 family peptidase [Bacteroidales bacterium]
FIAFGVEEKGLIGSRYFAGSDAYPIQNVNYMFNLDMIGRLVDNNLALIGTGSSPSWDAAIDQVAPEHFNIRRSQGGLGGSDHASFYMKGIPVLFLFTGIHDDYHRPGDTPDKVNFVGMYDILNIAHDLIEVLDDADRLAFTQTQAVDSRRRRADGVTLGVMPDHVHAEGGLKILAVINDRPAYRAGLLAGDIIVRINDDAVNEINSYMRALGNLRPGTVAIVTVQRGDQEITFSVQL